MNRAVFLDRDGTINKDVGYLHEKEKFEYIEGAVEGLKALQDMGYILVIVTNQSGIARGLFTEEEYLEFERWVEEDIQSNGIAIAGSYYCPHHPEAIIPKYRVTCDCRKPALGLFYKAADELDIDLNSSVAIGDKFRDLSICKENDTLAVLLGSHETVPDELRNVIACTTWKETVNAIKQYRGDVYER